MHQACRARTNCHQKHNDAAAMEETVLPLRHGGDGGAKPRGGRGRKRNTPCIPSAANGGIHRGVGSSAAFWRSVHASLGSDLAHPGVQRSTNGRGRLQFRRPGWPKIRVLDRYSGWPMKLGSIPNTRLNADNISLNKPILNKIWGTAGKALDVPTS